MTGCFLHHTLVRGCASKSIYGHKTLSESVFKTRHVGVSEPKYGNKNFLNGRVLKITLENKGVSKSIYGKRVM